MPIAVFEYSSGLVKLFRLCSEVLLFDAIQPLNGYNASTVRPMKTN